MSWKLSPKSYTEFQLQGEKATLVDSAGRRDHSGGEICNAGEKRWRYLQCREYGSLRWSDLHCRGEASLVERPEWNAGRRGFSGVICNAGEKRFLWWSYLQVGQETPKLQHSWVVTHTGTDISVMQLSWVIHVLISNPSLHLSSCTKLWWIHWAIPVDLGWISSLAHNQILIWDEEASV